MRTKRDREEPCYVCNHYHDYEGGEPCGVCGHVKSSSSQDARSPDQEPTLVLNDFLYLGSYDASFCCELLKAFGVTHVLNCVPSLEVLFRTSFTYHSVSSVPPPLDECIAFLDRCQQHRQRVLVYCMTGVSRSPTVVVAYLMKRKHWRLVESYKWVKQRRPKVQLVQADFEQLRELEAECFGEASVADLSHLEASVGYNNLFQDFSKVPT